MGELEMKGFQMFRKLIKWLTYESRKKRIEDKIFQRILKKYPDAEFYSRKSGKVKNDYELIIKYVKIFDSKTGKYIKTKKYIVLRFSFNKNNSFCETLILSDKNGRLHYNKRNSCVGSSHCSDWIKDYFI